MRKLEIISVNKETGEYMELETYDIADNVSCEAAGLIFNKLKPLMAYVVGTVCGMIKIFPFGDAEQVTTLKVHTIPIVRIEFAKSNSHFNHKSIALVMTADHAISTVNL